MKESKREYKKDYTKALKLLEKYLKDYPNIISHCKAVSDYAYKIAKRIKQNGYDVKPERIRIAALLHDIGRAEGHDFHGIYGGRILRRHGLVEIASLVEKHGTTKLEAEELCIPGDYEPRTIEERIVAYADGRFDGDRFVSLKKRFELLIKRSKGRRLRMIMKIKSHAEENKREIMRLLRKKIEKE